MPQRLVLVLILLLAAMLASAEPRLQIIDPWSPEAPPGRMMAGFMGLHNPTAAPIVLVDAHSPQFAHVEIHTMIMDEGVMRMRRLEQLRIEPGASINLAPGGLHLMFIEPLAHRVAGDRIEVELMDDQGHSHPLVAEVRARHRPGALAGGCSEAGC